MKFAIKYISYFLIVIGLLFLSLVIVLKSLIFSPPEIDDKTVLDLELKVASDSLVFCGDSWIHTNEGGISELFISGSPFEMGVKNGKLTEKLAKAQEYYFFEFIKQVVPSESMLHYLRYFIAYFNKDLDDYISQELREEIYGVSLFASDQFDFIGDKYHRMLNYHAAHDIGHTIQNMNLVNCTAFGVKNQLSKDSLILVGRNLDFSAGDGFARDKIVKFCKPDSGYNFAYISWGGMVGVLSGLNEHGLTISLNSAKSGIPMSAKSPVSLVAREVLQYARTIDEAFDIIRNRETFVSESFFISSAFDNSFVVIEKSLDKTVVYNPGKAKLVLTNHFQSDSLKNTELNKEAIAEGCTKYRWERTHELIDSLQCLGINEVVQILRDKDGMGSRSIGYGNESAINQLICHHSVVFNPHKRIMWVSQFPYQENGYLAYDLSKIFSETYDVRSTSITVDSLNIAPSEFYISGEMETILHHRNQINTIKKRIAKGEAFIIEDDELDKITAINTNYFYNNYVIGLYYKHIGDTDSALEYFNKSLSCQIPRVVDRNQVLAEIEKIKEIE